MKCLIEDDIKLVGHMRGEERRGVSKEKNCMAKFLFCRCASSVVGIDEDVRSENITIINSATETRFLVRACDAY